jgi:hypothetical protein
MTEFLIVPRAQMDEFRAQMDRLISLHAAIIQGAGTAVLPGGSSEAIQDGPAISTASASTVPEEEEDEDKVKDDGKVNGRYLIHRGSLSYADVVAREIPDQEFGFEDVAKRIEPLIHIRSVRWRESFRRSLEKDDRFERIGGRGTGERYRRVNSDEQAVQIVEWPRAEQVNNPDGTSVTEGLQERTSSDDQERMPWDDQERMPWDEDEDDDLPF